MFGPVLLAASRSDRMRRVVAAAPVTRPGGRTASSPATPCTRRWTPSAR